MTDDNGGDLSEFIMQASGRDPALVKKHTLLFEDLKRSKIQKRGRENEADHIAMVVAAATAAATAAVAAYESGGFVNSVCSMGSTVEESDVEKKKKKDDEKATQGKKKKKDDEDAALILWDARMQAELKSKTEEAHENKIKLESLWLAVIAKCKNGVVGNQYIDIKRRYMHVLEEKTMPVSASEAETHPDDAQHQSTFQTEYDRSLVGTPAMEVSKTTKPQKQLEENRKSRMQNTMKKVVKKAEVASCSTGSKSIASVSESDDNNPKCVFPAYYRGPNVE